MRRESVVLARARIVSFHRGRERSYALLGFSSSRTYPNAEIDHEEDVAGQVDLQGRRFYPRPARFHVDQAVRKE